MRNNNLFPFLLLGFSLFVFPVTVSSGPVVFGSNAMVVFPQVNATVTNMTVTVQTTTTETTKQITTTSSTSTSITTTITSTTITFPSIVMSTTVISNTQTNIISLTTTTTHTTNALALVWQGQDMTTLVAIAIFAIICIGAVVIFKIAGQKGDKPVGSQRKIS